MSAGAVFELSSGSLDLNGSLVVTCASFADWQIPAAAQSAPLHHDLLNFVPFHSAPRRMRLTLKSHILVANALE